MYRQTRKTSRYSRRFMRKEKSKKICLRLRESAEKVLETASKKTGMNKTDVLNLCILKHGANVPEIAPMAREALERFFQRA